MLASTNYVSQIIYKPTVGSRNVFASNISWEKFIQLMNFNLLKILVPFRPTKKNETISTQVWPPGEGRETDLFREHYPLFFASFSYLTFICYYMGGIIIVDMCPFWAVTKFHGPNQNRNSKYLSVIICETKS